MEREHTRAARTTAGSRRTHARKNWIMKHRIDQEIDQMLVAIEPATRRQTRRHAWRVDTLRQVHHILRHPGRHMMMMWWKHRIAQQQLECVKLEAQTRSIQEHFLLLVGPDATSAIDEATCQPVTVDDIVPRLLFVTFLCRIRYVESGDLWFGQAIGRLHSGAISAKLQRFVCHLSPVHSRLLQYTG